MLPVNFDKDLQDICLKMAGPLANGEDGQLGGFLLSFVAVMRKNNRKL